MADMTRRSFLEHTLMTAAAGLAAAQVAHAAEVKASREAEKAPLVSNTPPSERIRLAVIGLHGRGLNHIDGYINDDRVEIAALCDVDTSQFKKAQDKLAEKGHPVAKTYQDLRQLFDDKDIHAVSIATPNHWHALAGIWAMQAGKDVYVEKPVSHNVTEGRRLEDARVKYDRICQAGTQSRSNRATAEAIKFIHEGGIGKVVLARGLCYKRRKTIGHKPDSTAPATLAYDTWLGPAPKRPFNENRFLYEWHWNWDYGNGDIGNQGVHQMDIARWALNKSLPTSAVGIGGRFSYTDDGQTPNTLLTFYDFGDSKLLFEVRGLETKGMPAGQGKQAKPISVGDIIYGENGFVAIGSDYGTAVAFDKDGKQMKSFKGGGSHFNNFISAVKSHKQEELHCPVLDGHYSAALCHLGNISYRMGEQEQFDPTPKVVAESTDLAEAYKRYEQHLKENAVAIEKVTESVGPKLAFDPQAETFAEGRANAFLTRDYRAPFVVPAKL
ncbi:MAG TPA: Gfo/Idh/MocA family oxidoreductase [Tepidisphaeraceae bacterium]